MKILRNLKVLTGNIVVVEGQDGPLEFVSLGDYGQQVNLNQNKPVVPSPMDSDTPFDGMPAYRELSRATKAVIDLYTAPLKDRIAELIRDHNDRLAEIRRLESQLTDAISERNDYRATFDLQQTRMEKATKLWQKANHKPEILPES